MENSGQRLEGMDIFFFNNVIQKGGTFEREHLKEMKG